MRSRLGTVEGSKEGATGVTVEVGREEGKGEGKGEGANENTDAITVSGSRTEVEAPWSSSTLTTIAKGLAWKSVCNGTPDTTPET